MNITIAVASHKEYAGIPKYPPYSVFYTTQSELSDKNYCEIASLYTLWKSLSGILRNGKDTGQFFLGLVHYRRYFSEPGNRKKILSQKTAESLIGKYPVILPKKRNYLIESNYSHYIHAHESAGIDSAIEIISEKYPRYASAVKKVMSVTSAHMFNMFIMREDYFEKYCAFLFSILFELEKRLDINQWSSNEKRVFGFVAELMLDIWLETEKPEYTELPVFHSEGDNLLIKGVNMIKRKFFRKG